MKAVRAMADKFNLSMIDAIRNAQKKREQEASKQNKYEPKQNAAPQTAKESIQSGKGPVKYAKKAEQKQPVQTEHTVYVEPENPFKPKMKRPSVPSLQELTAVVNERGRQRREQLRRQASAQAHKKELKEDKSVRFQEARFSSGKGATVEDDTSFVEKLDNGRKVLNKVLDYHTPSKKRDKEKPKRAAIGFVDKVAEGVDARERARIAEAQRATQKEVSRIKPGSIIPESAALDESGEKLKLYISNEFETDFNNRRMFREQQNGTQNGFGLNEDVLSAQRFKGAESKPQQSEKILDAYGYEYSIKQAAKKAGVTPEEYIRNAYRKLGYELKDDFKLSDMQYPKKTGDYLLEGYELEKESPFLDTEKDIIKGDSIRLYNSTTDDGLRYGTGKDIHISDYLTESELNYYMFFLGRDGAETAQRYLDEIRYKIIDRATKGQQEGQYKKYAADNPISSYGKSLALTVEATAEGVINTGRSLLGMDITDATTRSGAAMNAISDGRIESAKTLPGKALHIVAGGLVENIPSMAINAVAPGAGEVFDFFTGVGQELGEHSRAGTLDNDAVIFDALVAGGTEAASFGFYSKAGGRALKSLAARTGINGLKAVASEQIGSILGGMGTGATKALINSAVDSLIMGEDSIYNRSLEMYKAYGFSEDAAAKKALKDAVISPAVSGMLIGGAMSAIYSVPGTVSKAIDFSKRGRQIRNSDIFKDTDVGAAVDAVSVETLLRYGISFGKNTDAGKSAEVLYRKYIRGEKISDSQLGAQDVLNRMEYARQSEYKKSITDLTKIEFENGLDDDVLEGMYDNGTIRMSDSPDSRQDDTIRHELTHGIENTEGYKRYSELIAEQNGYDKALASKKAEYDKRGIEYDDATLRSEVAAEFAKDVMPKTAEDFIRLKRAAENNTSLYDRMYNNIRDLRAKMKAKGGKVFTDEVTGVSISYDDLRQAERYLENALLEVSSAGYNEGSNMYRLRMRADQTMYGVNTAQAVDLYILRYGITMNGHYVPLTRHQIADRIKELYDAYGPNTDTTKLKNEVDNIFNKYKQRDDREDEHISLSDFVMQLYFNSRTSDALRPNSQQYKNDIKMFNAPVSSFVAGMFTEAGRDIKTEDFSRISDDLRSVYSMLKVNGFSPELEQFTADIVKEIYKDVPEDVDIPKKVYDIIKFYDDSQPAAEETDAVIRGMDEAKYGVNIEGVFRSIGIAGVTEGEIKSLSDITRNIIDHIENTGMYTKGEFGKFIDTEVAKLTYGRGRSVADRVRMVTALITQIDTIATSIIGKKLQQANSKLVELQTSNSVGEAGIIDVFDIPLNIEKDTSKKWTRRILNENYLKDKKDVFKEELNLINEIRRLKNQMKNINEWKKELNASYEMSSPGNKIDKVLGGKNPEVQKILYEYTGEMLYKRANNKDDVREAMRYVDSRTLDELYDELVNGTGEGREEWTHTQMARAYMGFIRACEIWDKDYIARFYLLAQDRGTSGGQMSQAVNLFYRPLKYDITPVAEKIHADEIKSQIGEDEAKRNRIETAKALDAQEETDADVALKKDDADYKREAEEIDETKKKLEDNYNKKTELVNKIIELSKAADDVEKILSNSRKVHQRLIEKAEKKIADEKQRINEASEAEKKINEFKKKFAPLMRKDLNKDKVKEGLEARLELASLGMSEDDAYLSVVLKKRNPDTVRSLMSEYILSVLDSEFRIKNAVKYSDAKQEHIIALSDVKYNAAEYRDMEQYNKNIWLYSLNFISKSELTERNGKMFKDRPNDRLFEESEMSKAKEEYEAAMYRAYEKEDIFNLARRQALAYSYVLAHEKGYRFNNSTERYIAYDEAFDRGEFNYSDNKVEYKVPENAEHSLENVLENPDTIKAPALREGDSISHYASELSSYIATLKTIRAKWLKYIKYTDIQNKNIEWENSRKKHSPITHGETHYFFKNSYKLDEDLSNPMNHKHAVKILNELIKNVEKEYIKVKQENEVLGWRQDVSDILSDEEIDALVKQYKLDETRDYTQEELFSIINRENALLNERLNNFVEGRENADNELVSVEQKMKVLRKTMRNLQKATDDKRSAWLQLKRAGAGEDELKTHLDSVYEELGVDFIKSADWKYLREAAAMINDMDSIDELIELILEASKVRGTAKGTTVYKNLMRAFGSGKLDGTEAEAELYNANLERLKGIASQQLLNMVRETGEVSWAAKLKQKMYINHLNNFATASRNFLANPLFKPLEDFSNNVPGLMLDKMFGMFTKTRGVSWVNPVSGFKPGVKRGLDSILETQLNVKILDDNAKNPEARIDADKSAEAHTYTRKFKKSFLSRFDSLVDKIFADSDNDKILRAKDEEAYNKKRAKKDKVRDGVKSVLDFSPYAMAERSLGYIMGGGDEFAKGVSKHSLTKSLDKLVKDGFLTADEAKAIVGDEIKFRTFQDDNAISNTLSWLQKGLNHLGFGKKDKNGARDFGLGDLIITYAKIPGNILARYLEYSPAGLCKFMYCTFDMCKDALESSNRKKNLLANPLSESDIDYAQSIKIFDAKKQRKAVMALARPLTGAGVIYISALLYNAGIIVGNPQNDYNLEQYERAKKTNSYVINLSQLGRIINGEYDSEPQKDDTLINIGWIAPLYGLMSTGAYIAHHMPEADDWGERFKLFFDANVFAAVDQFNGLQMTSAIRGLYNNAKNYGMSTDFLTATLNDWVTSVFIPQPVKQFANTVETRTYNVYKNATVQDVIKNKWEKTLPGNVGENAPFRVDIWGELEDNSIGSFWADLANNMLNPSKISKYKTNILTEEFDRLLKFSKEILPRTPYRSYTYELNGQTYHWELNDHDYQNYAVLLGSTSYKAITSFVMSEGYDYLPDSLRVQGLENISKKVDNLVREIWIGIKRGENPDKLQKRINEYVIQQKETAELVIKENVAKEYIKRGDVNVEDVLETGYYVPYTEQEKADYIGERTGWIAEKQKYLNDVHNWNYSEAKKAEMITDWKDKITLYQKQIDDMVDGTNKGNWKNITGSFNSLSEDDKGVVLKNLNKYPETIKLPEEVLDDYASYLPKSDSVIDITDGVPFEYRAVPNGKINSNEAVWDFSFSTDEYDKSIKPDNKPKATENKSEAVKELLNPDTRGFFERHKPEKKTDTDDNAEETKQKTVEDYLKMYEGETESSDSYSGGKRYYKKYRKYYSKGKRYYKKSSRGPKLLSNYKGRQNRSGRFTPRFGGGSSGGSDSYSSGRFTPRFNVR